MKLRYAELDSPLGRICVFVSPDGLCLLDYVDRLDEIRPWLERRFGPFEVQPDPDPDGVIGRLERYLTGEITAIEDIRVDTGGTPFQQKVWEALRTIPAGKTWSYGELARAVGAPPGASRAVGAANGSNPVAIVIPCHRVIRADGDLCGYGGGIDRKRWLLQHEGAPFRERTPGSSTGKDKKGGTAEDDGQLSLWAR